MKRVLVFIVGLFVIVGAFAVGENVPTSKSYVDTAIAQKQDTIPANSGAAQVLTNTGVAGEYGTKNIYDSSAAYANQTDALMTAGTMNAAVQNAIETEFKCISWVDDDPTKECLLLELRAAPPKAAGKNLFNINTAKIIRQNIPDIVSTKTDTGYSLTNGYGFSFILLEFGNVEDWIGKTLKLSAHKSCTNGVTPLYNIGYSNNDGSIRTVSGGQLVTVEPGPDRTKIVIWLYASTYDNYDMSTVCTYTNIQVEESTQPTAYEPYKNLYVPGGN